jgi:hypothetical protein
MDTYEIVDPEEFFDDFPRLDRSTKGVSQDTWQYNCIAFALGFDNNWWWPRPEGDTYWPPGRPRKSTIAEFACVFSSEGYQRCDNGSPEKGYQKIALYAKGDSPEHAARQETDGRWKSKCGGNVDIVHRLEDLEGPCYGKVVQFFRRPVS